MRAVLSRRRSDFSRRGASPGALRPRGAAGDIGDTTTRALATLSLSRGTRRGLQAVGRLGHPRGEPRWCSEILPSLLSICNVPKRSCELALPRRQIFTFLRDFVKRLCYFSFDRNCRNGSHAFGVSSCSRQCRPQSLFETDAPNNWCSRFFFFFKFEFFLDFYLNVLFWALENKNVVPEGCCSFTGEESANQTTAHSVAFLPTRAKLRPPLFFKIQFVANTDYVRQYCLFLSIVCF